jgi:hypothetical protein
MWIFNADLTCYAATYRLAGLSKLWNLGSVRTAEQRDRIWPA